MAENTNYRALHCSSLGNILKAKGIPHSNKKKEELVNLCQNAEELKLPNIDQGGDDSEVSLARRTVKGKTYPDPFDNNNLPWTNNLNNMPSIVAYDVTAYLENRCGWSADRLQRRKSDNAYKLHCSGHTHGFIMATLGDDMFYIKGKCVPETKQSNNPYIPWILVEKSECIFSAECTCVAGDGSCKHAVALLFGLADHMITMEDRATIGVTDAAAYWDKPRKVSRPVAVHNLDVRTDMNVPDKPRPSEDSGYLPLKSSSLDKRELEKDLVKILKESKTPAVALYTMSDSDDSNDNVSMFVEDSPPNIIELISKYGQENIAVDDAYINLVSELTMGQSSNPIWQYERKAQQYGAQSNQPAEEHNYICENPEQKYCQQDLLLEKITSLEAKCRGLEKENKRLKEENKELKTRKVSFRDTLLDKVLQTDENVKHFLGLPLLCFLASFLQFISKFYNKISFWKGAGRSGSKQWQEKQQNKPGEKRKLTMKEEFVLIMMKLRLGLDNLTLSVLFDVSVGQTSSLFSTWINFLAQVLEPVIKWPSRDKIKKQMPVSFKLKYPNTTSIIDCTEVFIQKPKNCSAQASTWSKGGGGAVQMCPRLKKTDPEFLSLTLSLFLRKNYKYINAALIRLP